MHDNINAAGAQLGLKVFGPERFAAGRERVEVGRFVYVAEVGVRGENGGGEVGGGGGEEGGEKGDLGEGESGGACADAEGAGGGIRGAGGRGEW